MKIFNGASYDVLPSEQFKLFLDFGRLTLPDKESEKGRSIISEADNTLENEIPRIYASTYRLFYKTGNRTEFESLYFPRRNMLIKLVLGEIITGQRKYIDKIIDVLWIILEESTWIIPAHNMNGHDAHGNGKPVPLPLVNDENADYIDLFSAETGAAIAFAYYFLHDKFDEEVADIINKRIIRLLKKRIITPFLTNKNFWWMGYNGNKTNNWASWIVSNVLTVTALTESDISVRKSVFDKALEILDNFLTMYGNDGGCNEGPAYWFHAVGTFFDCLEIIYDLTGGKADYFKNPFVGKMVDYIREVHLFDNVYADFADCPHILKEKNMSSLIARIGVRTNKPDLIDFAAHIHKFEEDKSLSKVIHNYRVLKDLCFNYPDIKPYSPKRFDILPDLQIAVIRHGGFCIAAKGGSNDESHNHNDIGNVIVFADKNPVFIDIGKPLYTKDVFDAKKRYTVFPINSLYHNLPVINGCGQETGKDFFADLFEADEKNIKIEYQSAYKNSSDVKKCVREINVSDDGVIITEYTDAGNVFYNYYLALKPEQQGNIFVFENGITVSFPDNVDCSLEEITITDRAISEDWKTDRLYKIKAEPKKDEENKKYTVSINKKKVE